MNLIDFPPEILDHILRSSSLSREIFDLIAAGCPILTSKILHGLSHVSLVADKSVLLPIPKAISLCRNLRSLSLCSSHRLFKSVEEGKLFLESLTKTLKTLSIRSLDSHLLFYSTPPSPGTTDPETEYPRGPSPWIDIEAVFPQVETLKISNYKNGLELHTNWLPALPSTLTSLEDCIIIFSSDNTRPWSLLPPTLRILNAFIKITVVDTNDSLFHEYLDHLANGHPNIEKIREIRWNDGPADVKWLPRSLKSCGLVLLDMRYLDSLPPNLESLDVQECIHAPEEWFEKLPRSLTSFDYKSESDFGRNVKHLPRNLKRLRSGYVPRLLASELRDGLESAESLWPPNLTTAGGLHIHSVEDMALIPRSLQYVELALTIRGTFKPIEFPAHLLPPNMTDLYLYMVAQDLQLTSAFPSTLTRLDLSEFFRSSGQVGLTHDQAQFLPSSLTELIFVVKIPMDISGQIPVAEPFVLPKELRILKVKRWYYSWIDSIPKGLTRLDVLDLHDAANSTSDMNTQLFQDLPPRLEYLSLQTEIKPLGPISTNLPAQCVASLTKIRGLTVKFGLFDSAVLRFLPKLMRVLSICLASLEPEDVCFISPHLTKLEFGQKINWKMPQLAEYWPLGAPVGMLSSDNSNYRAVSRRVAALSK